MNRIIYAIVIVSLLLHSAWQHVKVRRLNAALAEHAAIADQGVVRPDEFVRAARWLNAFYKADDGLQRPFGLCPDGVGEPDFDGLAAWVFDVYTASRKAGASEEAARQQVIERIRQTDEWRRKHVGTGG